MRNGRLQTNVLHTLIVRAIKRILLRTFAKRCLAGTHLAHLRLRLDSAPMVDRGHCFWVSRLAWPLEIRCRACGIPLASAPVAEDVTRTFWLGSTTGCRIMQCGLVARYMSVVAPLRPPLLFIAFYCTSPTISHALSLHTAKLSDFLTDNMKLPLLNVDGVLSGLFCREKEVAIAKLRSCLHHAMERVDEVCAGLGIHHRKRDMILALIVRSCHSFSSSGITRPGSVLFVSHRWGRHEPHDAPPFRMFPCLYADARAACLPVRLEVFVGIESPCWYLIVSETLSKFDV